MQEPLVPPDVDLRAFEYMPLDTTRLLDSDLFALSTGEEFKAAVALWCKSWHQVPAGSLPNDDRVLAHLSGAGTRWAKVRAIALRGWVECSDGRLYHPLIATKAIEAWESRIKHGTKREADRKRLQDWREKRKRNAVETQSETRFETRTKLVGEGEREETPPKPPPDGVGVSAGRGSRSGRPKRARTSVPEGFGVSDRVRAWAAQHRYDRLEAHLEHFVGYARANGKAYADWDQALMNAIRDDWARLREPLRANGRTHGVVVAHPSSATPDEATMRRISEQNGGLAVERLSDGRMRCGVHYYRPDGRQEVAL